MEAKLSKPNASNRFLCAAVYGLLQAFMWVAPIFWHGWHPFSASKQGPVHLCKSVSSVVKPLLRRIPRLNLKIKLTDPFDRDLLLLMSVFQLPFLTTDFTDGHR
jgi:hypothetical protein